MVEQITMPIDQSPDTFKFFLKTIEDEITNQGIGFAQLRGCDLKQLDKEDEKIWRLFKTGQLTEEEFINYRNEASNPEGTSPNQSRILFSNYIAEVISVADYKWKVQGK